MRVKQGSGSGVAVEQNFNHGDRARNTSKAALLATAAAFAFTATPTIAAPPLVLNNVGAPTVQGTGQGKRAAWANAGTVGTDTVDVVGVMTTATLNHNWTTTGSRPSITSVGQDTVFIDWYLYKAGTFDINTGTGGVPVTADIHVQFNDVDGPNNERVFTEVCKGDIKWVRIDAAATTGRAFGTVGTRSDAFSLIGDKSYSNEPESGLEAFWPNKSSFAMGRTANTNFFIRLDNPTYSAFTTLDYECADFKPPVVVDDRKEGTPGQPTVVNILANDSTATLNNNTPNNDSLAASEFGKSTVSLVAPPSATGIQTDAKGDVIGFTVAGEGVWAYSDLTGGLTFTPDPSFSGPATKIKYTVDNALGVASNEATVTVWYPGIGITKGSVSNDDNGDGFGQVGETITYTYLARAFGQEALRNVSITETGFTGAGATPTPVYASGDADTDGQLDLNETWTFTARYTLVAADLTAGTVTNSATGRGETAAGNAVTDTSDSTNPGDGNGTATPKPGPGNGDPTQTSFAKSPISADPDTQSGVIYTNPATPNAFNVLDGDLLKSVAATPATVTLSVVTPASNPGVSLDPATGQVSVAAGTPAGTYKIDYKICETANPSNCTTAIATVVVSQATPIVAADDTVSGVNGASGTTNAINAFANDTLNNAGLTNGTYTAQVTAPAVELRPGAPVPTVDPATGIVSVPAQTPAGNYTINYEICEVANPTNCDPAIITITVAPAPISAANDTANNVNGATGAPNVINVFTGDLVDGQSATAGNAGPPAIAANATVRVNAGSTVPAGLIFDIATGIISVAAGTPTGTYSFKYDVCEKLNPSNCATATATVNVVGSPLVATSNTASGINGATGAANVVNAFTGDLVNGIAATSANAILSVAPLSIVPAGLSFDPATGETSVAAGTPAGRYSFTYQLCERLSPSNCTTATITVDVEAAPITATDNNASGLNGLAGAPDVINVLSGDTLNSAAATPANVNISVDPTNTVPAGLTFETATGEVSVAPGTPDGVYSFRYQICEKLNPANCKIATVTVDVDAAAIAANPDLPPPVAGSSGGPAGNAYANDRLNGDLVDPAKITGTVTAPATPKSGGAPVPALDPATGNVTVPAGTPADTYTIDYQICEILNPANCANSKVTVEVTAATLIAANDTADTVNGASGAANALNVFASDTINGQRATAANATVTLAPGATLPEGISFDSATGNVSVAPGTSAGSYSFDYQICETLNPTNCKIATATVNVVGAPIAATNDVVSGINGATGAPNVANAFTGDTINGQPATPANSVLTIAPGNTVPPQLTFDPATGTVSVVPGTPAGSYRFDYQICEKLNPSNCQIATITANVVASPIAATADSAGPVNGLPGQPAIIDALANDVLNGAPATIANVNLTVTAPAANPGVSLDPATGLVSVAPGTPAGTYSIGYQVCEKLNPANCANATISVVVGAAPITAEPDAPAPVNGANGANDIINVFANDMLNGAPVNPAAITATVTTPATPVSPGAPVPLFDPATGLVDVPAGTPAGSYAIAYQICETLNPANCAKSKVAVVVQPPVITAAADTPAPVRSDLGSPNAVNAFANDTLNGVAVDPAKITATVLTPASNPGVVLDPATGTVSVAPNTQPGTYTIEYKICETVNPTSCAISTVTVVVAPPLGGISGTVYDDLDGNKAFGGSDQPRSGWIVEVTRDGAVIATVITDAQGNYMVPGLLQGGGYSVQFRNPENNVVYDRITNVTVNPGTTLADQNQPIDPSGVIYDSVTRAPVAGVSVRFVDASGSPLPVACFLDPSQANQITGVSGEYRFDIVPGAAPQCPTAETVYRIAINPPAGFSQQSSVLLPQAGSFDPTGLAAPVRITPSNSAPTDASPNFYLSFRLAAGDPDVVNNHIAIDSFLTRTPLIVTKTSTKRSANVGDVVPYEITVRNTEGAQRAGVTVVDILPTGMKYVLGTASVNGTAAEPSQTDRQLAWSGQVIPAKGSVRYNLTLVVGAGVTGGEKVNTGLAQNGADGAPISNRGTAVVQIVPSAVFDCSELLGKVFEDRNGNGYQDEGEPGVPGVRLVTVNGQLVTTDDFGRYHIACAAVPDARIGSNFVLKVDTRTLPLGWVVTTDNPRSIRLTRGKFGELNFGVSPPQLGTPVKPKGKGE